MNAPPATTAAAPLRAPAAPARSAGPARTPAFVWVFRALLYGGLIGAAFLAGPLGASLAVAAALFALLGDRDGLVRHLLRTVAFVAALILAPLYASVPAAWLAAQANVSQLAALAFGGSAIFFGVLLIGGLVGGLAARRMRRRAWLGGADRVGGALLGGAEGALIILSACWVLAAFREPLDQAQEQLRFKQHTTSGKLLSLVAATHDAFARDPLYEAVARHNPLAQTPLVTAMQDVLTVAQKPHSVETIADDPRMRRFMELPVVKRHLDAITGDEQLRAAFQAGDLGTVLASPQFIAMLNDSALLAAVQEHWDDLQAAVGSVRP